MLHIRLLKLDFLSKPVRWAPCRGSFYCHLELSCVSQQNLCMTEDVDVLDGIDHQYLQQQIWRLLVLLESCLRAAMGDVLFNLMHSNFMDQSTLTRFCERRIVQMSKESWHQFHRMHFFVACGLSVCFACVGRLDCSPQNHRGL